MKKIKWTDELIRITFEAEDYQVIEIKRFRGKPTQIEYLCPKKHSGHMTIGSFVQGKSRCPECRGNKKHSTEHIIKIFSDLGYTLLEPIEYKNTLSPTLQYRCPQGHINKTSLTLFKRGVRCPDCKGRKLPQTFDEVKNIFLHEGYEVLDTQYSATVPVNYICPSGHKHKILARSFIHKKSRCPYCQGRNKSFEDVREIFKQQGYTLLDTEYHHSRAYKCHCPAGHLVSICLRDFLKGQRCFKCINKGRTKYTGEMVKEIFAKRGYKVLDDNYSGSVRTPVSFICPNGHESSLLLSSFLRGASCKLCHLRGLITPEDAAYAKDIKLNKAEKVKRRNKKYSFEEVKEIFRAANYEVLTTQYSDSRTPLEYKCPSGHIGKVRLTDFIRGARCKYCQGRKFDHDFVKNYLANEGYELLSDFSYAKGPISFRCPEGHVGQILFSSFKRGGRCAICRGIHAHTIEEVREAFLKEGYEVLETSYKNMSTPIKYRCTEGHLNEVPYYNFLKGARCTICSGLKKYTFTQVQEIFAKEGYELLSTEYFNSYTPLKYRCPKGHVRKITLGSFLRGTRCRICSYEKNSGEGNFNWIPDRKKYALIKKWIHVRRTTLRRLYDVFKRKKDRSFYEESLKNLDENLLAFSQKEHFEEWRTTRGEWHIDHIIPVQAFVDHDNFDPDLINHINNLQILHGDDNTAKQSYYTEEAYQRYVETGVAINDWKENLQVAAT